MIATGANTFLLASTEIDQVVEDLLVSYNVFAVRISTEEMDYMSRYTGAKIVRMIDDLSKPDIIGRADRVFEEEENGVVCIEGGSGKNMVTLVVSGSTKETSLERWRASY